MYFDKEQILQNNKQPDKTTVYIKPQPAKANPESATAHRNLSSQLQVLSSQGRDMEEFIKPKSRKSMRIPKSFQAKLKRAMKSILAPRAWCMCKIHMPEGG